MENKTGTKELAAVNVNIQRGCEHNCRYCYARYNAVCRFKQCTDAEWLQPEINQAKVDHRRGKYDGLVMFPSSHDVTPLNINEYLAVLRRLLDAGNDVLIVTKPHWSCITVIAEAYEKYKSQIQFLFTIGSTDSGVLEFWEPRAANFDERLSCLQYAFHRGYKTGVICEPFLDAFPTHVYAATKDYITGDFWFGAMRDFDSRVNLAGARGDELHRYFEPLKKLQSETFIKSVAAVLRNKPHVKFKDSVRKIIEC